MAGGLPIVVNGLVIAFLLILSAGMEMERRWREVTNRDENTVCRRTCLVCGHNNLTIYNQNVEKSIIKIQKDWQTHIQSILSY